MVILVPPNKYANAADLIRPEQLARNLTAARARLNLTVADQARQIGVSKTVLTNLLAGLSPSYTTTCAVLRWLARV